MKKILRSVVCTVGMFVLFSLCAMAADVSAGAINVTIPTTVAIHVDGNGNVVSAGNAAIVNNGTASVRISDVTVTPGSGWTLAEWGSQMVADGKTVALSINGGPVATSGTYDVSALGVIGSGETKALDYDIQVPPSKDGFSGANVATAVYTVKEVTADYAVLYSDGTLAFQAGNAAKGGHGTITNSWYGGNGGWLTAGYKAWHQVPWYGSRNNIKSVETIDNTVPLNTAYWFYNCSSLTSLDVTGFDTSNVTSMSNMFYNCSGLTSLDLSNFDTSNVANMSNMFANCSSLTSLDLTGFGTSNAIYMGSMFSNCSSLTSLDVTCFNTSNVTNMGSMFSNCSSLTSLDVTGFDTSNVTSMNSMFHNCSSLTSLDVTGFNTSNVTNMGSMFSNCSSSTSLDVTGFDTSNVTSMSNMFHNCSGLISLDLTCFDTSNVTSMNFMFQGCSNLRTIYVSDKFIMGVIMTNDNMFGYCTNLVGGNGTKYDVSHIDGTYACIDKPGQPGYFTCRADYAVLYSDGTLAFQAGNKAKGGHGTIANSWYGGNGGWLTAKYTSSSQVPWYGSHTGIKAVEAIDKTAPLSMSYWFYFHSNLTSLDSSGFDTSNVSSMDNMFYYCSGLTSLDLSSFDVSNVTDMHLMFKGCRGLMSLNLSGFNTSSVVDMSGMFQECSSLVDLNLSSFDTSNVTTMGGMFHSCFNLAGLNMLSFDTGNVVYMNGMFYGCNSLTDLDLSSFDTGNVVSMAYMFDSCRNLNAIYVGNSFATSSVTSGTNMFTSCSNLVGGNGTKYSGSYTDKTYARIDKPGQPGYFTDKNPAVTESALKQDWEYSYKGVYPYRAVELDKYIGAGGDVVVPARVALDNGTTVPVTLDSSGTSNGTAYGPFMSAPYKTNIKTITFSDGAKLEDSNTSNMFNGCTSLTTINGMDTDYWKSCMSGGTYSRNMNNMFLDCKALTDVSFLEGWDVSNVVTFDKMFQGCLSLTSVDSVSGWNVSKGSKFSNMFKNSGITSVDLQNWNMSSAATINDMFMGCKGLQSVNVSGWDVTNVQSANDVFRGCSSLTSLSADGWVLWRCSDMSGMFKDCKKLSDFSSVEGWITVASRVNSMFENCTSLTGISLYSWDDDYNGSDRAGSCLSDTSRMFYGCTNLTTFDKDPSLYIYGVAEYMFANCGNLVSANLYDTNPTSASHMFDGCRKLSDIRARDWYMQNCTNMDNMFAYCTELYPEAEHIGYWNVTNVCTKAGDCFLGIYGADWPVIYMTNWDISMIDTGYTVDGLNPQGGYNPTLSTYGNGVVVVRDTAAKQKYITNRWQPYNVPDGSGGYQCNVYTDAEWANVKDSVLASLDSDVLTDMNIDMDVAIPDADVPTADLPDGFAPDVPGDDVYDVVDDTIKTDVDTTGDATGADDVSNDVVAGDSTQSGEDTGSQDVPGETPGDDLESDVPTADDVVGEVPPQGGSEQPGDDVVQEDSDGADTGNISADVTGDGTGNMDETSGIPDVSDVPDEEVPADGADVSAAGDVSSETAETPLGDEVRESPEPVVISMVVPARRALSAYTARMLANFSWKYRA